MPAAAPLVSTLADVLRLVERVFSLLGDGTPILIGKRYLEEPGPGSAPRVVFVPADGGKLGTPTKLNMGYVASWSHGCAVHVRGVEPGDDAGRFEPTYALAGRVIDVLRNLDPGHIEIAASTPRDTSPTSVTSPTGAEIAFTFTYVTNIAHEPAVRRAIAQLTSVSPPTPDQPGGSTGKDYTITTSAVADRE